MKVLFCASECAPIIKVGGLADVVGSLPKALVKLGVDVAMALPHYEKLPGRPPKTLPGTEIPIFYLGERREYAGEIYSGGEAEHRRFANFSRQIANFLETRQYEPDLVHCHDYHTSLLIDIIKERRLGIASLLTLHDAQNWAVSDPSLLEEADLGVNRLSILDYDLVDRNLNFLLQGVLAADVVTTVSPTYAQEILNPAVSGELALAIESRRARLFGVLNGIDTAIFDPLSDKNLVVNFGRSNFAKGKGENKRKIQEKLGLKIDGKKPIFAVVTRLVARKGIDLILKNWRQIEALEGQLVVLGLGEERFEEAFKGLARISPERLAFVNSFDEQLAHQVYAGSDFLLVPSRTEPCGLTQMIAMGYGTLPIVRATGGLADTVVDGLDGFVFDDYSPEALAQAIKRAGQIYFSSPSLKNQMIGQAMKKDFSWGGSAKEYFKLYGRALEYSFGIARGYSGEIREGSLGNWAILAEGRGQRPFQDQSAKIKDQNDGRGSEKDCPFEAGNEAMSGGEVFRIGLGEADAPGWEVRVVPNKYPLSPAHEVIVHSPDHFKDLDDLPLLWLEKVVWTYLSRYRHYEEKGYVHLFCNHGGEAAASLPHPHSQIVVLEQMPPQTQSTLSVAGEYYHRRGHCSYCDQLNRESLKKKDGASHFVYENKSFVLLTPYASAWPYELVILPKHHRSSFGNIKDDELKDLAQILPLAIRLLKTVLGRDLDYNFWIHSLPNLLGLEKTRLYYHWHLDLVPRVKKLGGLELGLGVMVDDLISPERAAQNLRKKVHEFI